MGEFYLRGHAERSPTSCLFCGSSTGPFVDTNVELPVYGWVYVCVGTKENPGCIVQMARLAGCADPGLIDTALDRIAVLDADLQQMRVALDDQRNHVLVDARDIAKFIEERTAPAKRQKAVK